MDKETLSNKIEYVELQDVRESGYKSKVVRVNDIREAMQKILEDIIQLKEIKGENIREIFKRRLGENLI